MHGIRAIERKSKIEAQAERVREQEQRIRLSAAAPDLLEALNIVLHTLTINAHGICECLDDGEDSCWLCRSQDTIRQAINKAKGA